MFSFSGFPKWNNNSTWIISVVISPFLLVSTISNGHIWRSYLAVFFHPPRISSLCKCAISRASCPLSMSSHDLSWLYTRSLPGHPLPFRRKTFSMRVSFTYRAPRICSAINPTLDLFFHHIRRKIERCALSAIREAEWSWKSWLINDSKVMVVMKIWSFREMQIELLYIIVDQFEQLRRV